MSTVSKIWSVGTRKVVLMKSGAVRIAEDDGSLSTHSVGFVKGGSEYTLATGIAGLIGLREVLDEVIEHIKKERGIK